MEREEVVKAYRILNLPVKYHDSIWKLKSELGYKVELNEVYKKIIEIGLKHVKEHWDEFLQMKEEKEKQKA